MVGARYLQEGEDVDINAENEKVKLDTEVEDAKPKWNVEALKLNGEAATSESNDKNIMHQAYVKMTPNPEVENAICEGSAKMYQQAGQPLILNIVLKGLTSNLHAISLNDGDTIEGGCSNAGEPYLTPGTYKINVADKNGEVDTVEATNALHIIKDQEIEGKINILGKTIVIYEKAGVDTGDGGDRLCCGVVKYGEMLQEGDEIE